MQMSILIGFLYVVEVVVCLLLGLVVMLQKPKEGGLGGAIGGGMLEASLGADAGSVLVKTTAILGAVFLLIIALFIAGLVINLPKIMSGEDVLTNLLAMIIGEASLAAFAYFTYRFFLKEYIDKLLHR